MMEKTLRFASMKVDSNYCRSRERDKMGVLVTTKTSVDGNKVEIDLKELTRRLQSLTKGCNIEVIQLAISSMLDEIEDAVGPSER